MGQESHGNFDYLTIFNRMALEWFTYLDNWNETFNNKKSFNFECDQIPVFHPFRVSGTQHIVGDSWRWISSLLTFFIGNNWDCDFLKRVRHISTLFQCPPTSHDTVIASKTFSRCWKTDRIENSLESDGLIELYNRDIIVVICLRITRMLDNTLDSSCYGFSFCCWSSIVLEKTNCYPWWVESMNTMACCLRSWEETVLFR